MRHLVAACRVGTVHVQATVVTLRSLCDHRVERDGIVRDGAARAATCQQHCWECNEQENKSVCSQGVRAWRSTIDVALSWRSPPPLLEGLAAP